MCSATTTTATATDMSHVPATSRLEAADITRCAIIVCLTPLSHLSIAHWRGRVRLRLPMPRRAQTTAVLLRRCARVTAALHAQLEQWQTQSAGHHYVLAPLNGGWPPCAPPQVLVTGLAKLT